MTRLLPCALFLMLLTRSGTAATISAYEYWFDDHYNTRAIQTVSGNPSVFTLQTDINTDSLAPGLHFFHIRFKDTEGKWSAVQSSFFIVPDAAPWSNPNNMIAEYEYWLDDNYALRISGSALASASFTFQHDINYATLQRGLHFFHIRFRDSEGKWSAVQSSFFIVPDDPPWSNPGNLIAGYRYWFDDNVPSTVSVALPSPVSSAVLVADISIPQFPLNTSHQFNMQCRDTEGQWSCVQSGIFLYANQPPVAQCRNVTVGTGVNACAAAASIDNGSYDPDNDALTLTQTPPGPYPVGTTNVTLTVTDASNAASQCTGTVTVVDDAPPSVLAQDITVPLDASGHASVTASMVDDGSADACGIASMSLDKTSFGCQDVGSNAVLLTVTDVNGNHASATAVVTVRDLTPPSVVTRTATVTLSNGAAVVLPSMVDDGSTDACGIQTMSVSPNAFICADIGTHTVTLTVTDNNGNTASAPAAVTVAGQLPVVTVTANPVVPVSPGGAPYTIYLGWGPQGITLTASGATSYVWSSNPPGFSATGSSVLVTPTASTAYSVVGTNQYGCQSIPSQTTPIAVNVIDVRCGNNLQDILVCHKCTGPNPNTLCIGPSGVQAHLNHGDNIGPCPPQKDMVAQRIVPQAVALEQNYPNPFSGETIIDFSLPKEQHVVLTVHDIYGREVAKLVDGVRSQGHTSVIFNAMGLPTGTYTYSLQSAEVTLMRVLSLVQ